MFTPCFYPRVLQSTVSQWANREKCTLVRATRRVYPICLTTPVHVGPAHENDRVGGRTALKNLRQRGFERLPLVLADAGYGSQPLAEWTRAHGGRRVEMTTGLTGSGGFTPVLTRRVVERSISWLQWDR